jgi:endonuclease/exonuclease/phosphatase family metal-dependent hydrolase
VRSDHEQRSARARGALGGPPLSPITTRVARLEPPSAADRAALRDGPTDHATFAAAFARFDCLHAVELEGPPEPVPPPPASLRILFWNAERLKFLEESAALLAAAGADVVLLVEVDVGMARSGNRHTVRDLAGRLGTGWCFAVEFVELDLGDARERARHVGSSNDAGLHGAAILSRLPLERPALVRLETSGRWFDGSFGERRVGGRMALLAEVRTSRGPVLVASVHLESHTDPVDRLASTRCLLDAIDAHAPGRPVLIGGDLNSSTFDLATKRDERAVAAALAAAPRRLLEPEPFEPLFVHAAARGYAWRECNLEGVATQRTRPDGTPRPPFGKIDWFLARGLVCRDPAILPAVDARGTAISDHEALAVTVEPLHGASRP